MVFCHERGEQHKTHLRSAYPSTASLCVEIVANEVHSGSFREEISCFPILYFTLLNLQPGHEFTVKIPVHISLQFMIHSHTCLLLQTAIEKTCEILFCHIYVMEYQEVCLVDHSMT
jgi:hypothetical protein